MTGGGFWSGARAKLASVAMLDCDMLLAGEAGRGACVKGEGEACTGGAGVALWESWRAIDGTRVAETGAVDAVGVCWGVEAAELALTTEIGAGVPRVLAVAG